MNNDSTAPPVSRRNGILRLGFAAALAGLQAACAGVGPHPPLPISEVVTLSKAGTAARAGGREAALHQVGLRAARLRFRQAGRPGGETARARLHPGQVRQRCRAAHPLLCAGRIAGRMHLLLPAAARSGQPGLGRQWDVAGPADRKLHLRRPPPRGAVMGTGLAGPRLHRAPRHHRGRDRQARQGGRPRGGTGPPSAQLAHRRADRPGRIDPRDHVLRGPVRLRAGGAAP